MLANSSGYVTETLADATLRTDRQPRGARGARTAGDAECATPTPEPPGLAIGILKKLLPHPEEWGVAGYDGGTSTLLPAPEKAEVTKALLASEEEPTT